MKELNFLKEELNFGQMLNNMISSVVFIGIMYFKYFFRQIVKEVGLSRFTLEFRVKVFILILVQSQVSFVAQLARWYLQEFNLD